MQARGTFTLTRIDRMTGPHHDGLIGGTTITIRDLEIREYRHSKHNSIEVVHQNIPIGMTLVTYSSTERLNVLVILRTRTQMKPAAEQNAMCHKVRVIGKGKPANASSHLLNRITLIETPIHIAT